MEIRDKVRQIKISRFKTEERHLLHIINGIESFTNIDYPNSVFWKKDGIILFELLETGCLWCNQKIIWSVFIDKYQYDFIHTHLLIKRILSEYLNLNNIKPSIHSLNGSHVYNINDDLTPIIDGERLISKR